MRQASPRRENDLHRRPLAACVASLFALAAPAAMATNRIVTSCLDDDGPGTLRSVIASPSTVSGDIVDLSALVCADSRITLAAGASHIVVPQASLTIKGPGAAALAIDGTQLDDGNPNASNVFEHTGNGTLTIKYLAVSGGHRKLTAFGVRGGCIFSNGNVTLAGASVTSCSAASAEGADGGGLFVSGDLLSVRSTVSGNSASSTGGPVAGGGAEVLGNATLVQSVVDANTVSAASRAAGGGVYAYGGLTVLQSSLQANTVVASSSLSGVAIGGGAAVRGDFTATYATISDNQVDAPQQMDGGGLSLNGSATIIASTISGNSSGNGGGGIYAYSYSPQGRTFLMRNSTVSGNFAANKAGGILVNSATTKIYNSTIAFNTATNSAPGVRLSANQVPMDATLQSTLISNNRYTGVPIGNDLDTIGPAVITFNAAPANNLIGATAVTGLPADTLFAVCPLLGPLRDNGGPTRTHALMSSSPAIDAGNDVAIDPFTALPYANDQRGSISAGGERDYVRVSGAYADIGAYEVQQDDVVFNTGFDGCL